ncbi:MAG: prolyl oligopeptidase family serine peptidase [Myxococcales bacterium]
MPMRSSSILAALFLLLAPLAARAADGYQKPPKAVQEVLDAKLPPSVFLSPTRDTLVLAEYVRYPSIADLAEPMLRLAGVRVNPKTNNERSWRTYVTSFAVKKLPDGAETPIALPAGVRAGGPRWNAPGSQFLFTNETSDRVELWVADVASAKARRLEGVRLNPLLGSAFSWMPDQKTVVVKLVPDGRGAPPEKPAVPPGPKVQESSGQKAAASTYENRDVLGSPHDADLFDFYTTSQLALVDVATGGITKIGAPAIYAHVSPAPGGKHLLVSSLHRPYSYLRAYERFPKEIEVWNLDGTVAEKLVSQPLAEQVPIDGVITGPRDFSWVSTAPATLKYVEALDGGDPRTKAARRDRLLLKNVGQPAVELWQSEFRSTGVSYLDGGTLALAYEWDRDRRWYKGWLLDLTAKKAAPRLVWDLSQDERYKSPGDPIQHMLPSGAWAVLVHDQGIYLDDEGATPDGDRPFLDRLDLKTLKTERLFRSEPTAYETIVGLADPAKGTFITRRESPTDPPNIFLRTLGKALKAPAGEAARLSASRPLTKFPDPAPQLRGITKKLVKYTRADGLPLSFTLYLPAGYKEGTRLPTVFWAYPLDYAGKETAGQITGSPQRFTLPMYASELFFLLEGYAVLDDVAMPVVGPPETVYDTYTEQIVADAQAAIAKAVELGVTDPDRVGVAGHSHGALMAANLLAWSDLFRAGIARSGAFNKTLTPFGFQNEKRTLWQAKDVYAKVSTTLNAEKIDEPLLLIHGELDANPGTIPMQSERMYEAVRGTGGTARLVMLPYESHGYSAKESNEQVLYESMAWFDRFVKNAGPRKPVPVAPTK